MIMLFLVITMFAVHLVLISTSPVNHPSSVTEENRCQHKIEFHGIGPNGMEGMSWYEFQYRHAAADRWSTWGDRIPFTSSDRDYMACLNIGAGIFQIKVLVLDSHENVIHETGPINSESTRTY